MTLTMEFVDPRFYTLPLRKVAIDETPETGRAYFIYSGKIVAVARYDMLTPSPLCPRVDSERRLST